MRSSPEEDSLIIILMQSCRGYGDSHGYGYGMGMGTVMNPSVVTDH